MRNQEKHMEINTPRLALAWRLSITVCITVLLFIIIWIASNFKEPPKVGWFSSLLILISYAVFETVHWFQIKVIKGQYFNSTYLKNTVLLFGSILAGTLCFLVLFYGFKWLDYWYNHSEPPMLPHMVLAGIMGLVMSIIFAIILMGINWKSKSYIYQLEHEQFKKDIAKANLATLKNQLDPHFMFNNFNTLYYLIDEDSGLAKQFLEKISTIYRYLLQNDGKSLVPLSQEYDMACQYLAIMKHRYADHLHLDDKIQRAQILGKQVPPLVLQQLIENAFKHNRIDAQAPLKLSFSSSENYLYVINNVNKKRPSYTAKTGLKNIQQRYHYLTDRKVIIQSTSTSFQVAIPLIHEH